MRNQVRGNRGERSDSPSGATREAGLPLFAPAAVELDTADRDDVLAEDLFEDELLDVARLFCPDCSQPIAVLDDEDRLPEHAVCPTPWNPFGLTVCGGSGRPVAEGLPLDEGRPLDGAAGDAPEFAVLLALPAGLDWRTQPFSHVGGPGSRPVRLVVPALAA
ncbi:hypothetical protein [Actinacidiphila rubida]|uniref:Uncharacterized protein n=1 Tax=Actinacidiphila rubida TaxID=310780 RepID=A0A1H8JY74_9ACTN|nr:hypothetical protein [Actinacidiphila rubida]SEN85551.1 hypothetical protein SAMN05216267_1011110 [Actinacidiphila rubida]